jgi:hypothetical protein
MLGTVTMLEKEGTVMIALTLLLREVQYAHLLLFFLSIGAQ